MVTGQRRKTAGYMSTVPLVCLLQLLCQSWSALGQDSSCEEGEGEGRKRGASRQAAL